MAVQYLLDTTVLLHWLRDDDAARLLEQQYGLSASGFRPLICEVSIGEMLAMSRRRNWGEKRRQKLAEVEQLVINCFGYEDSCSTCLSRRGESIGSHPETLELLQRPPR
jgi:predicted nucleic acid-binding protein